jgi:hypothetical protein
MHSTPIFMWKPNAGENYRMLFLYVKNYIQGSTNFQFSSSNQKEAPTSYALHLQPEGGYNQPILFVSNRKVATTPNSLAPTRRRLQPPNSQATTT